MRKIDRLFLLCVLLVAGMFAAASVKRAVILLPSWTGDGDATAAVGRPRAMDMRRLRVMLRQHRLSDHEARYYRRLGGETPAGRERESDSRARRRAHHPRPKAGNRQQVLP